VESLEDERVLKADLPGCGGLHEALVADEEDHRLVCSLRGYPADLFVEQARSGESQVAAEGQGAYRRPIEEDGGALGCPGRVLPLPLQDDDLIDEGRVMPRRSTAQGVAEGNDVCRGFLNDRVPADFQQAQDGRLPGPGSTGENVGRHGNVLSCRLRGGWAGGKSAGGRMRPAGVGNLISWPTGTESRRLDRRGHGQHM
jgi:hypothetical protein